GTVGAVRPRARRAARRDAAGRPAVRRGHPPAPGAPLPAGDRMAQARPAGGVGREPLSDIALYGPSFCSADRPLLREASQATLLPRAAPSAAAVDVVRLRPGHEAGGQARSE